MASRSGYTPVFASAAVEFFTGLTRRRQRKLLDRVNELAVDPFVLTDFQSMDSADRTISHLVIDDFILDYWVDHAERQIIITAVDSVD